MKMLSEKKRKIFKRLKKLWYKTGLCDAAANESNFSLGCLGKNLGAFTLISENQYKYFFTKPFYYQHLKYLR